jgi:hypothetical protein
MVYEPAAPVMPRPENVTTPLIAATVTVPRRDAPAEPAVIEAVTEEVVETANELASWNATTGWVVNAIPLTAPAAFVVLTIFVAAAAPRVIVWVATVKPDAVKVIVYEPDGPVIPRLVKVTTPLTALTVTVPINEDPAEPAVKVAVTDEPVETVKLLASWKATTGCVVKAVAETAPDAFVTVPIFVAAAAPRVIV